MSKKDTEKKLKQFSVKGIKEVFNGSNRVFLCEMVDESSEKKILSIYKPIKGERPLRDFFVGNLCSRELAAYEISKQLGWPNLPPLVNRDGPFGFGSFQMFIDHEPKYNYFNLFDGFQKQLKEVIFFDHIILNTDRKAGSIILDDKKQIWAIDQALTFNPYTRIRTVMFEFNKMKIDDFLLSQVEKLLRIFERKEELFKILIELLSQEEIESLIARIKKLLKDRRLPELDPYINVPYPLV
ncbi:MAG: hypothetical protein FI732_00840 [SAR202 cluster bacterium]|nr:hypothetical protein [SAR202 cluster bacterium]